MPVHSCNVCGSEKPVWRCSRCGRSPCHDHYGKRAAQSADRLEANGGEHHPRNILHPVFN
ncbi:MAG: hypothetical protein KY455_03530 [Euryarchaeota archaeon]|nr:hypothetical protein [Euryarchaeota archaeon]